ncbi:MAG: hypothetical protein ABEH43_01280 [Flavobacteriales bacterium]
MDEKKKFEKELIDFFDKHDKWKVRLVPQIVKKFAGHREEIMEHLRKKYEEEGGYGRKKMKQKDQKKVGEKVSASGETVESEVGEASEEGQTEETKTDKEEGVGAAAENQDHNNNGSSTSDETELASQEEAEMEDTGTEKQSQETSYETGKVQEETETEKSEEEEEEVNKKKGGKGKIILVILLLVIVGAGVAGYMFKDKLLPMIGIENKTGGSGEGKKGNEGKNGGEK